MIFNIQSLLPLLGSFGFYGSYVLAIKSLISVVAVGLGIKTQLFLGIPSYVASLCWSTERAIIKVGIPVLCILLFVMHPVGRCAAPYALYWLIPIVLHYLSSHTFFTSLASTFTAHAVGSVMHLYCFNTLTAAAWLQLMPIVFVERLLIAGAMFLLHKLIFCCINALRRNEIQTMIYNN